MAKRNGSADGFIVVTLRAFQDEDGYYVSECVELQTASQGDDLSDAIDQALDATRVYLDGISEFGDRDHIFRERGIRVLAKAPAHVELRGKVQPGDMVKVLVLPLPQLTTISA